MRLKRLKISSDPPPHTQVPIIDQILNKYTNSKKNIISIQRLEQLDFSHTSVISPSQTLRATSAHLDMTFNYFMTSNHHELLTDHMTGNKSILSGFTTTTQPPVQITNGSTCNNKSI
jgi:hypothetical protein